MSEGARQGCVASANGEIFGPRCGREGAFTSPLGPLCEVCAERVMGAIRSGETVLNVIAEHRGVSIDDLLAGFRRIQ